MFALLPLLALAADPWLSIPGTAGPGKGKTVVLISGDEEYRSEEALPQLAKILATRHGFDTVTLFAIEPATGEINPNNGKNIPGLEALAKADLVVMGLRFRALPPEQMKLIDEYLMKGKPVIGLRTSTHAFNMPKDHPFAHYGNGYNGEKKEWADGGFGRLVLGEKWISHHGSHGKQATRGGAGESGLTVERDVERRASDDQAEERLQLRRHLRGVGLRGLREPERIRSFTQTGQPRLGVHADEEPDRPLGRTHRHEFEALQAIRGGRSRRGEGGRQREGCGCEQRGGGSEKAAAGKHGVMNLGFWISDFGLPDRCTLGTPGARR